MRFPEFPLEFQVVQRVVQGYVKDMTSIAKLARRSKMSEARSHYRLDYLGIVSLNILNMACIGTWSFCYMSFWSSQMYWLIMIVDSSCIWP
ncbi:putative mannan endo-1,4-beta-mannosidase C [Gossypium arboreum]|uniref:Putative mannan endo-1,4-beta-mannosidase C n=1 Tax=Gossypium arboreum TaxID=29729 RepID=A0A0B0MTZ0_GOSAR|nr:putative mannan endo-1,4-beta-mannosidase C [Gossypium arboreum]KHG10759.1 putative mannan endo-1,4-beta-mannosidase C [Gossypium arboreum]